MELFKIQKGKLQEINIHPFKLEKDIQSLIENNVETLFGLEFICTEFTIDEFRIDSLCFNQESNSFVIIEYKKGSSYSLIDQGYSYMSKMLNNKDTFILEYCRKKNVSVNIDINWEESKVIFISPSFNAYQKNSVNFKDVPFELWEITKFENNTISLNQYLSQSKESINKISIGANDVIKSVNKQVKVQNEDDFRKELNQSQNQIIDSITEKVNNWDGIRIDYTKKGKVQIWKNRKVAMYINKRKSGFKVDIVRAIDFKGNVDKTDFIFKLNDPEKMFKQFNNKYKKMYICDLTNTSDIDYFVLMLKQKYDSLK
tara:strand:- start:846 stop:1787 length:942 start_codon:yes stop_codon:yes gene_type:complete